ncbi:MAG: DUF4126 domain-containing protein, partial [bacterium]
TATTGGMANAVVATTENILSAILSVLSFIMPVVTAFAVFLIIIYLVRKFWKLKIKRPALKTGK